MVCGVHFLKLWMSYLNKREPHESQHLSSIQASNEQHTFLFCHHTSVTYHPAVLCLSLNIARTTAIGCAGALTMPTTKRSHNNLHTRTQKIKNIKLILSDSLFLPLSLADFHVLPSFCNQEDLQRCLPVSHTSFHSWCLPSFP